ncbi:MAG: nicotinate (nicotinamide) nucleotide adenylyltransferase [Oscillospiraceae bacterium]|nr:nicotinate (nicotinamide) nucleotide adenylyltransferase [Oscillospiraceae bacterium]
MRIGVLGGSFNPPHNGHIYLGERATSGLALDIIYIIPAFIPPHKDADGLAPAADRLNMCRLAFPAGKYTVSDMEIARKGKSFTIDTVKTIKNEYPGAEIFLIIGSDMMSSFDTWYKYKEILGLCTVFDVSRDNMPVSSTMIREKIKGGGDISSLVPKKVEAYIEERRLYV